MMLPFATYKTFEELAEYARQCAKISADRYDPQGFANWLEIRLWALDMAEVPGVHDQLPDLLHSKLSAVETYSESVKGAGKNAGGNLGRSKLDIPRRLVTAYAHAFHIYIMLVNRGHSVPRLSLSWLRKAADSL